MEILDPRVHFDDDAESATFELGAPLAGANVGLRLDRSWRSYFVVIDEWKQRLAAEGANVHVLYTGERVGSEGETTRSDLDEWSRLVDCAVVGLGN
ncbi:MAG: hypothetical protein JOZ99_01415 [Actinobacteria bacterium]|nr:hypothetical protein [Actinomycetota bacterium]